MMYENDNALIRYYEQVSSVCTGGDECVEVRVITPKDWADKDRFRFMDLMKAIKHEEGLPEKPWSSIWFRSDEEELFVELCRDLATDPAASVNVFMGPNPRGVIGGTTDSSVSGSCFLFADGDAEHWDPSGDYEDDPVGKPVWKGDFARGIPLLAARIDELISGPIRPCMVVDTGHGLHPYVRISDPLVFPEDLELWMMLMDRFRLAVSAPGHHGADKIANPSRIMRLPGVVNYKGTPVATKMIHYDPTAIYSAEYLDKHLPKPTGPAARKASVQVSKSCGLSSRPTGPIDADLEKLILALETEVTKWKTDSDGNFSIAELDTCVYCEGGNSHDRRTAFVTNFGLYRCHRAKCAANKGVNIRSWASRFARREKLALVLFLSRLARRGLACSVAVSKPVPYSDRENAMDDVIEKAVASSLKDNAQKVVSVPTGVGKTTAAGKRGTSRRIALLLQSHKLCDEMKDHLIECGVPAKRIGTYIGVSTGCQYPAVKEFPDAELARRLFCSSCPDKPTCAAHQNDCSVEVLLAPHAAYQTLFRSGALDGREVYFDERPQLVEECKFSLQDVRQITNPSLRKAYCFLFGLSLECTDSAAILVKQIDDLVEEWKREYAAAPESYPRGLVFPLGHVPPDFSVDELATIAKAGDSAAGRIPPVVAAAIREGRKNLRVRLGIPKLFAAIHSTLSGTPVDAQGIVEVTMRNPDSNGNVEVVFRVLNVPRYDMPSGASLTFLDATAHLQPHEYNAACRQELEHFRLEVEPHPGSTVHRLLLAHNGASRTKSCDGQKGASPSGRRMLQSTLGTFAVEAKKLLPNSLKLAVITHKPLARELEETFFGRCLRAELARHGVLVEQIGYFGADERASNSMQDCDAIMVIGESIPNIDAMHTLAEAVELFTGYQVSHQTLIDGEKFSAVSQALGRLRAFTRAGEFLLCCVSNTLPEGWDSDNTHVINLSSGGGLSPLKRLRSCWPELDLEIENVLNRYGVCSHRLVMMWLRYQFETAGTREERNRIRDLNKFLKNAPDRTRQRHFKSVCESQARVHRLGNTHRVVWADLTVNKPEEVKAMIEAAQEDMETKTAALHAGSAVAV